MIGEKFYYAGDAFHLPNKRPEILAWPSYTPWAKYMEAIEFINAVKPNIVFPVHDGTLKPFATFVYGIPNHFLSLSDITFKKLEIGIEEEI